LEEILKIINIKNPKNNGRVSTGYLQGKTFVITGALSRPREYFSGIIESLEGKVSSSVSKNTDYVLLGENENGKISTKEKSARELGIKIISEEEFERLLK
jgi:DNA ligase (NAD+)